MTLRLVALMSVVLLLSLAAVGLLVNHYQEQFMQEVQATASDVGQAALRTLEWTGGEFAHLHKGVVQRRTVSPGAEAAAGSSAPRPVPEAHGVIVAQVGTGERSEKIRTYNYPQNRVTDHRIGMNSYNLPAIMEGNIDDFIEALALDEEMRRLAALE